MATPSMTQARKKRKRFAVHNATKNCGNCGCKLYEDDDIIKVEKGVGILESPYFHATYRGCQQASELRDLYMTVGNRAHVVNYGQS